MNLARPLIEKPLIAWVITLVSLFGGLFAYINIGRLEDPKFTIKTAVVVTFYPGASAKEVENEVTDRLESSIQQMEQVRHLVQPASHAELTACTVLNQDAQGGAVTLQTVHSALSVLCRIAQCLRAREPLP